MDGTLAMVCCPLHALQGPAPLLHMLTLHINYAQWPVSHTNDTNHESHVVCLQIAGEKVPAHEAAFQAINSPLLQNLELQGISRHKVPGHVWLSFYSAKAADKVRKAGIIELGVQNQDVACAAASPLMQFDKRFGAAGNTQRSLNAWAMVAGSKTISTLCEVSTALIGLLIPVAVTSVINLLLAVLDSLLRLPHYIKTLQSKTRKWLQSFCIVDLVERGDQQTHGVADLSLICCAYITTHENEHCFDDSLYCIYLTVLGYMVQIVLAYLTQWLTSSSMTIAHIWFTQQHQSDRPRCANGKFWSRIRYRHRKADQKRHCKLLTRLLGTANFVQGSCASIAVTLSTCCYR